MSNSNSKQSRREFVVRGAAGGLCLLTFNVAGGQARMPASDARKAQLPFSVLSAAEVSLIDALGEALLPGSAAAGLSHYLDHQLAGDAADSLLMIKYLRVNPPYLDFYRAGWRAVAAVAHHLFGKAVEELSPQSCAELIRKMSGGSLGAAWQGPPAPFFYFVMRSDAVDVTYGTEAGFASLGVPYMPHIAPPSRWGE